MTPHHLPKRTYGLKAGVSKREITTQEKTIHVKDPLFAKVLVLDDGKKKLVIIALDALAIGEIGDISDDFLPELRERIEKELKIPASHILVNASHTHPPGRILREESQVLQSTFEAVSDALEQMVAVNIGAGSGSEDRISMNRNLTLKNGQHWTIRHANPCPPDEEVQSIGPLDTEIGVLRVDRLDGTPFAVVYNFACHLLFADTQGSVSANFPGIASRIIEENLGHDTMALFLQGAAGDVIDVGFKDFNKPREIETLGSKLGLSTLDAVRGIQTQNASLNIVSETIALPRRTDIPRRIEALQQEQGKLLQSLLGTSLNFKSFLPLYLKRVLDPPFPSDYFHNYLQAEKIQSDQQKAMDRFNQEKTEKYLRSIQAMERLALIEDDIATLKKHQSKNEEARHQPILAEVMGIKIGDCVIITAPLEILTEVSLNIKSTSPYKSTFMAAFTNGYMHYGPPASYYERGSYEVVECFLAPEWEELYVDAVNRIIHQL